MKYYIKGELKSVDYFLQNGWKAEESFIIDNVNNFSIMNYELNSKLNLIEITDYQTNLELQDEGGTQYKKEWFEKLDYSEGEEND